MEGRRLATRSRAQSAHFRSISQLFVYPKTALLAATTAVSIFQIYTLPLAGIYVPLSLLLTVACVALLGVRRIDRPLALMCGLYWLTMVVSVLWSPDKIVWANGIVYQALFFIGLLCFRWLNREDITRQILRLFVVLSIPNALSVIVFRLSPGIKLAYLGTGLRRIFTNPNFVDSVAGSHLNVFDEEKAGGFLFDNGNTGAAFNMLCLGVAISLMRSGSVAGPAAASIIFLLSIVASGSKSALLITVAVAMITTAAYYSRTQRRFLVIMSALITTAIVVVVVSSDLLTSIRSSQFSQATEQTTSYRVGLLNVAAILFKQHPLAGLGFGGWARGMRDYASLYGLDYTWPPHNSLVLTWSQSGLLSLILLIAIFIYLLRLLLMSYQKTDGSFRTGGALIALLCVTAMSLGDPYPLFGSSNMEVPLGAVIAFGIRSRSKRQPVNKTGE